MTAPVRHQCVRCGRSQPRERLIYSRYTTSYYCLDFDACDKRAVRRMAMELRSDAEMLARQQFGDALLTADIGLRVVRP
jgi:hypothetical protein